MCKRIISFAVCMAFVSICFLAGCGTVSEPTTDSFSTESTLPSTDTSASEGTETSSSSGDSQVTTEPPHTDPLRPYVITFTEDGVEYSFQYDLATKETTLFDIYSEKETVIVPAGFEDEFQYWRISRLSSSALTYLVAVKKLVLSEGIEWLDPNFPPSLQANLEELYLPASLQILGTGYENGEDFLGNLLSVKKGIYVDDANPWYCDVDGVLFTKDMSILLKAPENMGTETYTVPDGVRVLYSYACSDMSLKNLILPEGLLAIKEHALTYCSSIRKLDIPASVVRIDKESLPSFLTEITVSPNNPNFHVEITEDGRMRLYDKYGELIYTTQAP